MKNHIQKFERKLDYEKQKEISRLRVISLRLHDYMIQSGRTKVAHSTKTKNSSSNNDDLFYLLPVLQDFADEYRPTIAASDIMDEAILNKYFIKHDANPKNNISTVRSFYTRSLTKPNVVMSSNFRLSDTEKSFFYFIELFLNTREEEFGIDYKYHFYKDIYDFTTDDPKIKIKTKIKAGIYRLERLSSLHKAKKISVSKLEIIECIDIKGKNIFNDPDRSRFRFVEKKYSVNKNEYGNNDEYESTCKGRVVIRNRQNYIFLGATVHESIHKIEKTLQIMSLVVTKDRNFLEGVALDTTGGKSYIPFAARVRAELIAEPVNIKVQKNNTKNFLSYKENIKDMGVSCARNVLDSDTFFTDMDDLNKNKRKPRGIISALLKD